MTCFSKEHVPPLLRWIMEGDTSSQGRVNVWYECGEAANCSLQTRRVFVAFIY